VFGARPLEDVVRNCRSLITQELESALVLQTPPTLKEDPSLHELPPLVVDGIPTPVEKMTQAQLRAFIPLMLKYSTGRGKPGWGKESTKPVWWPKDLPWANVRSDARLEEDKQKVFIVFVALTLTHNVAVPLGYLFVRLFATYIPRRFHGLMPCDRSSSTVTNIMVVKI
jgi:hypothetical protein